MRVRDWLFKYFPMMIFITGVLISLPGIFFTNVMANRWKRSLLERAIAAAQNTIDVLYDEATIIATTISSDYDVAKPLLERRAEELCVALTRYQSVYAKDQHFKGISVYDENLTSVFCTAFSGPDRSQLPELAFLREGSPVVASISVDEGEVHVYAAVPLTAFGDFIGALRVSLLLEQSLRSLFPESKALLRSEFESLRSGTNHEGKATKDEFVEHVTKTNLKDLLDGKAQSIFVRNSLFLFLPLRTVTGQVLAAYAIKLDATEFFLAKNLLISLQLFITLALSLVFALLSRRIGKSLSSRIEAIRRSIERL